MTTSSHTKTEQPKQKAPEHKPAAPVSEGLEQSFAPEDVAVSLKNLESARPEAILRLQRVAGNRAVTNMLGRNAAPADSPAFKPKAGLAVQTKSLIVSQPGDEQEMEADQVSEQIMRMPDQVAAPPSDDDENQGGNAILNRYPSINSGQRIQRDPAQGSVDGIGGNPVSEDVQTRIEGMQQGGQPLPAGERDFFEPRMGVDLGNVRIHTDSDAADTSKELNARAYTIGSHVAFNSGEFQPGTTEGRKLLGHELTHVVQQGGAAARKVQRAPSMEEALQEAITQVTPEDVDKQDVGPVEAAPAELQDEAQAAQSASVGSGDYKPEGDKQAAQGADATQTAAAPAAQTTTTAAPAATPAATTTTPAPEAAAAATATTTAAPAATPAASTTTASPAPAETTTTAAEPGPAAAPTTTATAAAGATPAAQTTTTAAEPASAPAEQGAASAAAQAAAPASGQAAAPASQGASPAISQDTAPAKPEAESAKSQVSAPTEKGAESSAAEQAPAPAQQEAAAAEAPAPASQGAAPTGQGAASAAVQAPAPAEQGAAPAAQAAAPAPQATPPVGAQAPAPAEQGSATTSTQASAPASQGSKSAPGPDANPAFQGVVSGIAGVAAAEKQHEPGTQTAEKASAAAQMPEAERMGQAQNTQAAGLEAAATAQEAQASGGKAPGFDKAAFVKAVKDRIDALTPKDPKKMENIESSGVFSGAKEVVDQKVKTGKEAAEGNVDDKIEEEPNTSAVPEKPVTPLQKNAPGSLPAPVNTAGAIPTTKQATEVERPIEAQSRGIDDKMAAANVTEEQLKKSNEPSFQAALNSKNEAQTKAKEDLQSYRVTEQDTLKSATKDAQQMEDSSRNAMHGERSQSLATMDSLQTATKGQDEGKRAEIGKAINDIFTSTENDVTGILKALDAQVDQAFNTGAEAAKSKAMGEINKKTKEYKDKRYEGVGGFFTGVGDFFTGMPPEYYQIFADGRDLYVQEMEVVLNQVADIVGDHLTRARVRIAQGRKEIADYVAQQPKSLRDIAQKAAGDAMSKFDALEQSVDAKQDELVDKLAQNYSDALGAMDAELQKMKDEAKGLLAKAADAVTGVINTIIELGKGLAQVLGRVASVVGEILKDPIGFVGHLLDAVKQGFMGFVANIGTYLQSGFITWLTGTLGGAGIKMPEKLDLPGILDLVLQILGLTYDQIRAKVIKALGPKGETIFSALEKAWEIFTIIRTEGLAGLWEFIKDMVGDLQTMVIEQIKSMIMEQVIQAGVKWLLGLLAGPAGAFIKAIQAIISVVSWFINNAGRIMSLVNSILDSVEAIAAGNIGGAAKFIEESLGKAVPLIIGFLADLLGLGGISKKVQGIIQKIQAPINKAINWVVQKAVAIGKKLMGALGGIGKKDKKDDETDEPDERTMEEKQAAVDGAIAETEALMSRDDVNEEALKKALPGIKSKYKLVNIELVKESDTDVQETVHVLAEINPKKISKPKTFFTKMPEYIANFTHKKYDKDEYQRQLGFAQKTIWSMKIDKWFDNREAFIERAKTGSGRDPKSAQYQKDFRDREELGWKAKRIKELRKLDPSLTLTQASKQADDDWSKQAALHPLDQVAGGEAEPTEIGDSKINSSIGSTWRGHMPKIDEIVEKINPKDRAKWHMNVTITLDGSPI